MRRLSLMKTAFFMVNFNGSIETESQKIDLQNRGLHYGDALFETIRETGGKLTFFEAHYFRLMASMRILRMEIPMNFTLEFFEEEIKKTIDAQEQRSSAHLIKILVWRKTGGKYTPKTHDVSFAIFCSPLNSPFYLLNETKYEVELFKDHYVAPGLLSTLKTTNKMVNILGSIYAEENGYDNCLLLNDKKQVVEALNANLFVVKGSQIKTAPVLDGCLKGIIRNEILKILVKLPDYDLVEASISPFELQKADELFITNVRYGIQSISKFRKKEYGNAVAKDLLGKLNTQARLT